MVWASKILSGGSIQFLSRIRHYISLSDVVPNVRYFIFPRPRMYESDRPMNRIGTTNVQPPLPCSREKRKIYCFTFATCTVSLTLGRPILFSPPPDDPAVALRACARSTTGPVAQCIIVMTRHTMLALAATLAIGAAGDTLVFLILLPETSLTNLLDVRVVRSPHACLRYPALTQMHYQYSYYCSCL